MSLNRTASTGILANSSASCGSLAPRTGEAVPSSFSAHHHRPKLYMILFISGAAVFFAFCIALSDR
jgi:hypothetical protein